VKQRVDVVRGDAAAREVDHLVEERPRRVDGDTTEHVDDRGIALRLRALVGARHRPPEPAENLREAPALPCRRGVHPSGRLEQRDEVRRAWTGSSPSSA
jgi:hypothetical protein